MILAQKIHSLQPQFPIQFRKKHHNQPTNIFKQFQNKCTTTILKTTITNIVEENSLHQDASVKEWGKPLQHRQKYSSDYILIIRRQVADLKK